MIPSMNNINIEEGIKRTGNSSTLYMRFLKRFPSDPSFYALKTALNSGDMEEAFRYAHTLKGLTEQLGIIALSTPFSALCELLRQSDPSVVSAGNELLCAISPVYNDIISQIASLP